jgi:hypothetical protein
MLKEPRKVNGNMLVDYTRLLHISLVNIKNYASPLTVIQCLPVLGPLPFSRGLKPFLQTTIPLPAIILYVAWTTNELRTTNAISS